MHPNCYQNHGMGKSNWCGDENCPMNPKKALEKAMVFFRQVFEKAWCRDTCWHKMEWDESKPKSAGQCYVTALIIQDEWGGKLVHGKVNHLDHYWNQLPDGTEIDLTSDQFSGGDGLHPHPDRKVIGLAKSVNRTIKRYKLLKQRFEDERLRQAKRIKLK